MLQFKKKSENNNESEIEFNENDMMFRLKKLQRVITKQNIDSILIINGVDSKKNEENEKLTKWLLLGSNGINVINNFLNPIFDELMIYITINQVYIYCEKQAYEKLFTKFMLPSINVFLNHHPDNQELQEVQKIAYFLQLIKNHKKIGMIPGKKDKNNIKNIEKWPLIQAYALESTARGYFAQNHQIVNIGLVTNELFKQYDKFNLVETYNKGSQLSFSIIRVFTESLLLNIKENQEQISERLTKGLLCQLELEQLNENIKEILKPWSKPYIVLVNKIIQIENVDIISKLRVIRTYFNFKNHQYYVEKIEKKTDKENTYCLNKNKNIKFQEEEQIISRYFSLIKVFKIVMQELSENQKNLSTSYIKQRMKQELNIIDENTIQVQLSGFNSFGEQIQIDLKDNMSYKLSNLIYCLRLQYQDLIYGNSFMILEDRSVMLTSNVQDLMFLDLNSVQLCLPHNISEIEGLGFPVPFREKYEFIEAGFLLFQKDSHHLQYDISIKFYTQALVLQNNFLQFFFINFDQVQQVVVYNNYIKFNYQSSQQLPCFQSLQIQSFQLHFQVFSQAIITQIVTLLKNQQINYIYGEQQNNQRIKQDNDINISFQYLEYKQNIYYNKNIKSLSIQQYNQYANNEQQEKIIEKESSDYIEWIIIDGRDVDKVKELGQSIKTIIEDKLNVKCYLYTNKDLTNSLEKELQLIQEFINLNNVQKKDHMIIILNQLQQQELTEMSLNQFSNIRIKLRISKLCIRDKNVMEMVKECSKIIIPGFQQALIIDQIETSQSHFDFFIMNLRKLYKNQNIIHCINNKFNQQLFLDCLNNNHYQSIHQIFLRHLNLNHYSNVLPSNQAYQFFSFRVPVNLNHFIMFIHKYIMKIHSGFLHSHFIFNSEISKVIDQNINKENIQYKKESQLLEEQMKNLNQTIQLNDDQVNCLNIQYIKGIVLDENNKIHTIEIDTDIVNTQINDNIQHSLQEINIKNRTYTVQLYHNKQDKEIPIKLELGFVIRGFNFDKMEQLQNVLANYHQQSKTSIITKEQVDQKIVGQLEFMYQNYGLEDGQFFDGSFFREFDGKILEHHPKRDQLIDKYVKDQNYQIAEINRQKEKDWKLFLFKYNYQP